jgi:hypothetical protein
MSKRCGWIALALGVALIFMGGCSRTSEAKVTVYNTGELTIKVTIYYSTSTISVGNSDTFTVSWPGRNTLRINMVSYPVNQTARLENTELLLKNGDDISLNVEFKKL